MGKKAKPRSPRVYSEVQLPGIRHSNTIGRLVTLERLFQQYMRIERARHDPGGRTRLEELDEAIAQVAYSKWIETSSTRDDDEFDRLTH